MPAAQPDRHWTGEIFKCMQTRGFKQWLLIFSAVRSHITQHNTLHLPHHTGEAKVLQHAIPLVWLHTNILNEQHTGLLDAQRPRRP